MPAELFANNFTTTLAAVVGLTDTTITVAAAAPAPLQGAGEFRVLVGSEDMIVTAGASGTVWTVTRAAEGSVAATHAVGVTVAQVLTEGGLEQALSGAETTAETAAQAATATAVGSEATRAETAEAANASAVSGETTRAEAAEGLAAQKASNLSDLVNAATARANLGLGSAATQASSAFDASGAAASEQTRAQAAEALLAPKASPVFTGVPSAPTAAALDASTKLATTAYSDGAVGVEKSRAQTAEGLLIPLAQKNAASGVAALDANSDLVPTSVPLGLRGNVSTLVSYGNSYCGGGASDGDHGYMPLMAAALGVDEQDNYGIGGAFLAWDSANGQNGGISYLAQRERRHVTQAPYASGRDVVILDYGYEDLTLGVLPANTPTTNPVAQAIPIFINALRTAVSIARSSAQKYAGDKATNLDPSITLTTPANWTASAQPGPLPLSRVPAAVTGHPVGYVGTATSGAGGAFSITIPGDYPGSAVCPIGIVLGVGAPLGITTGTLTASGASTGTLDLAQLVAGGTPANTPGTYDAVNGKYNLLCFRFAASSAGAGFIAPSNGTPQTLTITPSSLNGLGFVLAGWHIEAQNPPDVIVPGIASFGNPGILVFQGIRNSDCAAMTTAISNLIANEFNDGTVISPLASLGGSGNVLGLNGTAGNTTAATVVSSTGLGGTTAANCQVTSTANPYTTATAAFGGPTAVLAVGSELVAFTGATGAAPTWTLTGVTRGYNNTTAAAHAGNPICDLSNPAALHNYAGDFTHPADDGQALRATTFLAALQQSSLNSTRRPKVAAARVKIYGAYGFSWTNQIIPASGAAPTFQAIKWDQTLDDSASMHDPTAGPGVFALNGTYDQVVIPADGIYAVKCAVNWTYSRLVSSGGASSGGVTAIIVKVTPAVPNAAALNATPTLAQDTRFIGADVADLPNAFWQVYNSLAVPDTELHKGDILQVLALQGNQGSSGQSTGVAPTTLSAAITTTTATTCTVASATGLAVNDYVRVDDEQMLITAISSNTLTVTRAQNGTQAFTHSSGASLFNGRAVTGNYAAATPSRLTVRRVGRL